MGLDRIAEQKKKLGLTTEELSDKSGVPVGTLNKILSGATKDPKLETLKALSRVLGLTLSDFDDAPGTHGTLAAHFNGEEYTEEEWQEINDFAAYVRNKRRSRP